MLRASVNAIASFGEQARSSMLDVLADVRRRELHRGALLVLARIVSARSSSSTPDRGRG